LTICSINNGFCIFVAQKLKNNKKTSTLNPQFIECLNVILKFYTDLAYVQAEKALLIVASIKDGSDEF